MSDVRTTSTAAPAARERGKHHGSFIWYELITSDPDGAKAFYEAVVGWSVETGKDGYGHLRAGETFVGGMLGLTNEMKSGGAGPTWLGYIAVDDVDQAVTAIEKAGGKALMPAFDIEGVGRIALVADPQGAAFYVMKPIPPEGREEEASDAFSPDKAGSCAWNELATSDPNSALDFYTAQFGWQKGDSMPMGATGEYRFISRDGQMIGAVFPAAAGALPDQRPKWRFYFRVADVDRAKQAIESGGGSVTMGPHEVPGGDRILIGVDPQGAEFAIVGK